jgi:hypothetical protein
MGFTAVQFDDAARERIKVASALEKRLRLESYLNVTTMIGPFEVRPMLVRHALEMEYGENRLNLGEAAQIDDLVHFLWVLRPETDLRTERAFAKFAAKNITEQIRDEIINFFALQFLDMPSMHKQGEMQNEYDSSVWLTVLLHELCRAYSWSIKDVMETPIGVALQLIQQLIRSNNPKYSPRNPLTQAAKAEEMKGMN